ncbi:hypothetical protein [Nitrococcus mobilis]|uniref:Uncharacterized protein n=1 Tax=Nitrococcus mobilis Nb-231 TaxID=314278 RepID=A4BLC6_9GAMM|nr:hypothetical protein [Nitrococcus mobilis]EAR23114.1 hypothetical protein NB231_14878 [Nitrococcus mobilis Nb-231]
MNKATNALAGHCLFLFTALDEALHRPVQVHGRIRHLDAAAHLLVQGDRADVLGGSSVASTVLPPSDMVKSY